MTSTSKTKALELLDEYDKLPEFGALDNKTTLILQVHKLGYHIDTIRSEFAIYLGYGYSNYVLLDIHTKLPVIRRDYDERTAYHQVLKYAL